MAALISALGAWPARLCTVLPRLSAVPAPLAAWPSPRTLGTLRVACSAAAEAPGQGAKLVSGGRRRRRQQSFASLAIWNAAGMPSSTVHTALPQMRKRKRRLDEICLERHPEHSRNVIQSWIAQGAAAGAGAGTGGAALACCTSWHAAHDAVLAGTSLPCCCATLPSRQGAGERPAGDQGGGAGGRHGLRGHHCRAGGEGVHAAFIWHHSQLPAAANWHALATQQRTRCRWDESLLKQDRPLLRTPDPHRLSASCHSCSPSTCAARA